MRFVIKMVNLLTRRVKKKDLSEEVALKLDLKNRMTPVS